MENIDLRSEIYKDLENFLKNTKMKLSDLDKKKLRTGVSNIVTSKVVQTTEQKKAEVRKFLTEFKPGEASENTNVVMKPDPPAKTLNSGQFVHYKKGDFMLNNIIKISSIIIFICALWIYAISTRYQTVGSTGNMYILDNWTGNTYFLRGVREPQYIGTIK